jgi:peptidoglycan/LPS O-acetylase OafA/YrhL
MYGISTLLYFADAGFIQKFAGLIIKTGTWLGGISYAIYLVHFPLLVTFGKIHFFTGSVFSYIVRFILFLFILINAAYFLEKIYQPYIKKFIRSSGKSTRTISPSIK